MSRAVAREKEKATRGSVDLATVSDEVGKENFCGALFWLFGDFSGARFLSLVKESAPRRESR